MGSIRNNILFYKMNTKQTATEFLFEKLWETPKDKLTWNAILEQAKEMDKNNIINAAARGYLSMPERFNLEDAKDYGQQYYNNTYDK
jgi:hypothetical protein